MKVNFVSKNPQLLVLRMSH